MHSSKGLAFPVVFIPKLGYLPNRAGEVADEARLLYVATTRAIERLVLIRVLRIILLLSAPPDRVNTDLTTSIERIGGSTYANYPPRRWFDGR